MSFLKAFGNFSIEKNRIDLSITKSRISFRKIQFTLSDSFPKIMLKSGQKPKRELSFDIKAPFSDLSSQIIINIR